LQSRYQDFRARNAEVVAVSSSSVEDHRALAQSIGASFPILSDREGKAMRAFGVFHPHAMPGDKFPVARPAVLVLDGAGMIRERFLTDNWRVRVRPENLLQALPR
jgi:peroxiredoxin